MGFSTSGVYSSGYSGSALRFGLMDIKPIEVVKTVKKFGMKFRRVTRSFERLTPSKSFDDLMAFKNEAIFGSVSIPKWFDAEKLITAYSQHSIDQFKNDVELQKEIVELKRGERKDRPLLSFIQYMKQRFESKRDLSLEVEAHRFLNSNLPLSFYHKLVVFDNTYYDLLGILENIVRIHEFRAAAAYTRSFDMYKKKINEMKRHLSPIIDHFDTCFFSSSRIKKFLSIWNSKDYKEIFYPKFLDIKKVDYSEFREISKDFNMKLKETRAFLFEYDSEILKKSISPEDPTSQLFGKLVKLPSSSLDLKC